MKKFFLYTCLAGMMLIGMTACDKKKEAEPAQETLPTSFVKKHLLEEFTGQTCGYCPYGMNCVHDFVADDPNWIVVLHHYGYQADNFSVAGSKDITSKLHVKSAPSMTIDRAAKGSPTGAVVYNPGYLSDVKKSSFDAETYASVVLTNSYDASSRELTVKVSGVVLKEDYPDLKLTVLVKESGMIDYQADYNYTFKGWQQFRHVNAVRAYLNKSTGNYIEIGSDKHYEVEYTTTLNDKWVAENCMVVAILADDFQPVVQAEQAPVVAGTAGGADITHGGIQSVPVPDYYPEPSATTAISDYTGNKTDTINDMLAYLQSAEPEYGVNFWIVQGYNANVTYDVDNTACVPFINFYLYTDINTPTNVAPKGTFPINNTFEPGTVEAGIRVDSPMQYVAGSMFYLASLSVLQQGYVDPMAQWLIADGTLVIDDNGWSLTGHARNGTPISFVGTSPVQIGSAAGAPQRAPARSSVKAFIE